MSKYLLGIDVGTTSAKIGLFNISGERKGFARLDYKTFHAQPEYAEQNALDWWDATKAGIAKCMEQSEIRPYEIMAVGVDSMTPCLIPVDRMRNILSPVQIWSDKRAIEEVAWIRSEIGEEEIFSVSGNRVTHGYLAPKIIWLRRNKPDIYEKTFKFLQPNGYINLMLTDDFSMDRTHSELTLLANKISGMWDEKVCSDLGISLDKMPEVKESTEVIGHVTSRAAIETGLEEGIPVIAGGNDSAVASFAMDVVQPGNTSLDIGNASNIGMCINKPVSCRFCNLYHHVVPKMWIIQVYSATTGAALRWFKEELAELESITAEKMNWNPFMLLDAQAALAAPGCSGILFIPFLNGAHDAPEAKGCFLGLTTATKRSEIIRSVLEGCAFAVRRNMEFIEKATGIEVKEIHLGEAAQIAPYGHKYTLIL